MWGKNLLGSKMKINLMMKNLLMTQKLVLYNQNRKKLQLIKKKIAHKAV